MAEKRFTIQGFRDYRGVPLSDLIEDLGEHRDNLKLVIESLKSLQTEIQRHKELIDEPEEIEAEIDYIVSLFSGHQGDLMRLVKELPVGVQEIHIEIVNQIYESARFEFEIGYREFKSEYISRELKDESMRPLLDDIGGLYGGTAHNLWILSDISVRLRTFLGESLYDSRTIEKKIGKASIPVIELPPDTRWEDIKLIFIGPEDIQILVKGKPYAVKSYKALGFLDRRTNKKTDVEGKPNRLWTTLAALAKNGGELSWDNVDLSEEVKDNLVKNMSDLRKHLQAMFRIGATPIDAYKRTKDRAQKAYQAKFEVALSDSEILERLIDWTRGPRDDQTVDDVESDENS
jgi:hypothetical protein